MATNYRATYVSLHVRKSNKAALALYRNRFSQQIETVDTDEVLRNWPPAARRAA